MAYNYFLETKKKQRKDYKENQGGHEDQILEREGEAMAAVGGPAGERGVGSLLGVNISALATSAPDLTMMTPTELDAAFQDFARIEREAKRRKTEESERRNDERMKSKKTGFG